MRHILAVALLLLVASESMAGQNVVILLDNSGSMKERMRRQRGTKRIEAAKSALHRLLSKLPQDAEVGLLVLNGGRDEGWLLRLGDANRARLSTEINRLRARGGTPLGEKMKVAADALLDHRERHRYGTYKLLIVTDGEANDQNLLEAYLPDILSRGLVVDVIGVDMKGDHSLATRVQTYRRADDPASLEQAIAEVVLGESTGDVGDAGESDFEMLAGLPDEIAVVALAALSQQGNAPIVETTPADVQRSARTNARTVSVPTQTTRTQATNGVLGFLFGACMFSCASIVVLTVLAVVLISKGRR